MIEFVAIPTEQTTAATDVLLGLVAFSACFYLLGFHHYARQRALIWSAVCCCTGLAALLGTVAHGIVLSHLATVLIWSTIFLFLSLTVALFLIGALWDSTSRTTTRRLTPLLLLVAMGFFAYSLVDPDNFLPFVLFELCAMVLSLAAYLWLTFKRQLDGAALITLSILLTLVAATIQATKAVSFTFVWPFDHNSVYHLIQAGAIVILARGLSASMAVDTRVAVDTREAVDRREPKVSRA